MTRQAFDVTKLHDVPVKACPHCREKHVWSIADARLGLSISGVIHSGHAQRQIADEPAWVLSRN